MPRRVNSTAIPAPKVSRASRDNPNMSLKLVIPSHFTHFSASFQAYFWVIFLRFHEKIPSLLSLQRNVRRFVEFQNSLCEAVRQLVPSPLVPVLRSRATAEDGGGDKGEGDLGLSDRLVRAIFRGGCQTIFLSLRTQEQRAGVNQWSLVAEG
jgi:hypothetical protein